jgi:hypothetical protein
MRFYNGQHRHYCGIDLHVKTMYVPWWTGQIRPLIDRSKPAIFPPATETSREFYFGAASVRKSVWTFVRQLRGPHLST